MKQVLFGMLTGLAVLKLMFFATLLASCNSEDVPQVKTTVKLNKSSVVLTVGETYTLIATTTPVGQTVSYSSDKLGVAKVDPAKGIVTAVATGTAKITVSTPGGAKATCTVTVNQNSQPGSDSGQGGDNSQSGSDSGQGGDKSQPGSGSGQGGDNSQPGSGSGQGGANSQPGSGSGPGSGQGGANSQPGSGSGQGGANSQPGSGSGQGGDNSQPGSGSNQGGDNSQPGSGSNQGNQNTQVGNSVTDWNNGGNILQ